MRARFLLLGLAFLVAPCALAQTSAPVDGAPADLGRFVGEWTGEYACEEAGWHGALAFRLAAGEDSIWVSVVPTAEAAGDAPVPEAAPLVVRYVAVEGRSFHGSLAPYEDPGGGGTLATAFGGSLSGDGRIEGYFRAEGGGPGAAPHCGRWWAARVPDRPVAQR